ncbi:uncharacterized protein H6S33_008102 [Morchella sextelata]|uniref:uncharacterized protein n=1 Tax=Morchella sextelata TaxID=1174677 RepID=UPI001D0539D3|nr:uncharacterized protein H6S33_008102 [Morchella sextelata]KAH0603098.1 hypothetical protein H6S33_008102 [Morchella sextelata]
MKPFKWNPGITSSASMEECLCRGVYAPDMSRYQAFVLKCDQEVSCLRTLRAFRCRGIHDRGLWLVGIGSSSMVPNFVLQP